MNSAAATLPAEGSSSVLLSALPDERLAKLAAQGSAAAFAVIYKRHHQDVYRYCQSVIGNEQDARDALQETMIKAMRALPGERREIALRPWLFRIAHNESVTLIRRRRPSTSLESLADLPEQAGDAGVARERVRELFDDLEHLTSRQRGALVMRELNGLSFAEIAASMSISATAAKQTVYEARQALLDVARGRETDCSEVRKRISARDRRLLRGRGVSAHLRSCAECREFELGIAARGERLAGVAPLPAAVSAGILDHVIGAAGGGAAGGGGIAALLAGGSLTTVAKLGVAGVVALGVGTLAVETRDSGPAGRSGADGAAVAPAIERAAQIQAQDGAAPGGPAGLNASKGSEGGAHPAHRADAGSAGAGNGSGSHSAGGVGGAQAPSESQSPSPSSPSGGSDTAPGSSGGAAGGTGSGSNSGAGGGTGGGTGGGPEADTGGGSATGTGGGAVGGGDPGTGGGSSAGGEVLLPGQGGTPPGQGGTPPGLDGQTPPGHGGTPPGLDGEVPPGQGGTPPGQGGAVPPGHGGTPPGQG